MTTRYAERSEVSSDRSRAEIEKTLKRYGATGFGYLWEDRQAVIMFQIAGRRILFRLPLPDQHDPRFMFTAVRRNRRSAEAQEAEYEYAIRQRWRALCLVIKAKLEAVELEITTIEQEFLAHIVLPDGKTVGEHALAAVAEAYSTGTLPALLPGPGAR